MSQRAIGKNWTIGQKPSTSGQDGSKLREAKFVTGRDVTDQSVIRASRPNLPRILEAWRTSRLAQTGSRRLA
jgi:hypothetical protein